MLVEGVENSMIEEHVTNISNYIEKPVFLSTTITQNAVKNGE